ncbi:MAG: hypothetical protein JXR68_06305 [Bacteroidales bacterium]|nr:hypothetical protein [Bacteroidales bacterium]
MDQKKILFLVVGIFSFIFVVIILQIRTKSNFKEDIIAATNNQFEEVEFYKDYLRDDADLNLKIADQQDIDDFISILKTITPASYSIKSLDVEKWYKLRFYFVTNGKRKLITVEVLKAAQTGDVGVISITKGDVGVTSIGIFGSEELLKWAENMQNKPGYENISGSY